MRREDPSDDTTGLGTGLRAAFDARVRDRARFVSTRMTAEFMDRDRNPDRES